MKVIKGIVLVCCFGLASAVFAQDKLDGMRTTKQIITMDQATSPYYAVQILALKLPPSDADFFKQFDVVKEYPCNDGFVRYTVGGFQTFSEAKPFLETVKSKGYADAVIVNTKNYNASSGRFSSRTLVIDSTKMYLIQLSAFRFPVYLSYFEKFETVYEFRMDDKIFRYTTAPIQGDLVESELERIRQLGYPDAFIVEMDVYIPFKIE